MRGAASRQWCSTRRCLSSTWTPAPGTWPSTMTAGRGRSCPSAQTSWVRATGDFDLSEWGVKGSGRTKRNVIQDSQRELRDNATNLYVAFRQKDRELHKESVVFLRHTK